jgi:molybdate-binding protein/DNA-binding XRE family transcriptional regulator
MSAVRCFVRKLRQEAGLQQKELAARVGVSRQTLSAIEAGTTVPSTALALDLARVLGCRVEDLFALAGHDRPLPVSLAPSFAPAPAVAAGSRVRLGFVRGRWLAHGLAGDNPSVVGTPADGIVARQGRRSATVRPLRDDDSLRANLLVAGCDPALGLLAGHLLDGAARLRLHWIEAASEPALDALARGLVHVAGLHLFDAATGEHNVPAIRARLGGAAGPTVVVNLAAWPQGLVIRPSQKTRIRRAADLAAPGVRFVAREPGSGARSLLERILGEAKLRLAQLDVVDTAYGHHAVARAVAAGEADAGIATAEAAAAHGLAFVPLAEDRFDLVMLADTLAAASGQRVMETLASGRFRRDAGALAGYGTAKTGQIMARVAA